MLFADIFAQTCNSAQQYQ